MSDDRLEDYVDVAARITAFKARYPDGSLQTLSWEVLDVAGKTFVVYRAGAYRNPHDRRPGHGTAWEPFPGPTPFTRDSELMNAETAAWGRAIVAVGITASRKLASAEELSARGAPPAPPPGPRPATARPATAPGAGGASDAQRKRIHVLLKEHNVTRDELQVILDGWQVQLGEGWMDRLTPGKAGTAHALIDVLGKWQPPQGAR